METKAVGQITIIDFNDAISLSGFITSNVGQSVITNTSLETFTPDFSTTHAVLTPHVFLSNRADVDIMESLKGVKEVVWLKQTNEMDAPSSLDAYEVPAGLTNHSRLIIENNPFSDTVTSVTYSLKVTYEDEASHISYMVALFFTFSLLTQGEKGEAGASAEAIIEYALVKDGEPASSATWSEILPAFQVGYSYWRRVKTVWSDGREISYSEAVRDDALTNALKSYSTFTFQMSRTTFTRNLRNKSDKTIIQLTPIINGYGLIKPIFYADGVPLESTILELPYSDERLSVRVNMKANYLDDTLVSDFQELKAIDGTVKPFYLGAFEDEPTSAASLPLLEGDWYFSTKAKKTYVYTASGSWKVIENSDENFAAMALSTLPDKFASALNVEDEVIAENIYVKNLISSFVTAQYIATKDLELLPGGALRSKGYNKGTVKKLINGEELPAGSPERGFYLDTAGDAEFYRADMFEVNINKGNISDVTVTGELKADTFTTLKENIVSEEVTNTPLEEGVAYYAEEDLATVLSAYESAIVHELSGAYMGSSFSKAVKLTIEDLAERKSLINASSYSESSVSSPGVKVSVRFEGEPTSYHFISLNGDKEVQGKIEYSTGGSWYELTETVVTEIPAVCLISMRGVKPEVPSDALVFTKKKYKTNANNIKGYAFKTPELSGSGISCIVVSEDGLSRHTFNQDASVCSSYHSGISFSDYFAGCAYANSRLLILDGYKRVFVSTDGGKNVTSYSISIGGSSSTREVLLAYDGVFYIFVFSGSTISSVVYSSDGTSWSKFSSTSFGITRTMRDFVQVGSYLYALETGGKVVRTPNLGYFETLKTFDITSSYPGHLSYANSTFFISNGTTLRASKDAVNWYEPLYCTNVKAVLPLDSLYCIKLGDNGITNDDVYEAELMSQNAGQIYDRTRTMKASFEWSPLNEGWNFITANGDLLGSISISSPQMVPLTNALRVSDSSSELFNSETAMHYYRFRGLRKYVNGEYVALLSGVVGKIDLTKETNFSYRLKGGAETTIDASSIRSISWDSKALVLTTTLGTISFSSSDWFSALNITFTPVGRSRGNYTEDIYPETLPSDRETLINLGAADNPFDVVYANILFGKLGNLLQELGDSKTDVVSQKAITDAINKKLGLEEFKEAIKTNVYEAFLNWGGRSLSGSFGPVDAGIVPELGANRLAYGNASAITVQYSRNGGSSWSDYGASNSDKVNLFTPVGSSFAVGKCDSSSPATADYMLRVIIDTSAFPIYTVLNKFLIYISTSGSQNCWCTIEASIENSPSNFITFADKAPISGWSGYNIINTSGIVTYGNTPSSQYGLIRFTFGQDGTYNTNYAGLQLYKIFGFGGVGWTCPSNLAKYGVPYSFNSDGSVSFSNGAKGALWN